MNKILKNTCLLLECAAISGQVSKWIFGGTTSPKELKYLNNYKQYSCRWMHYSILFFFMPNPYTQMCEYQQPLRATNPSAAHANQMLSGWHHFLTVQQCPSFLTLSLLSLHYNRKNYLLTFILFAYCLLTRRLSHFF